MKTNKSFKRNWTLDSTSIQDWPQIESLLNSLKLPVAGLREHLGSTIVARLDDKIIGCTALELYGQFALLRSVVVEDTQQGKGLGQELTSAALDLARQNGIIVVYLLTETASEFFRRFGFEPIDRPEVPPVVVQQSIEFTSACPASALTMALSLR